MSFELLPTLTPWLIGFVVVAALGLALAVGAVTAAVLENRPIRLARRQSIPTYYGRLVLGH